LLGNIEIRNLVITMSVFSIFKGMKLSNYTRLIRHSVLCAMASKSISSYIGWRIPEEAFIAGLLHDIGKFVIAEYFPKEYHEITKNMMIEDLSSIEVEEKIMGVQHVTIGQWLCEKWNLPIQVQETVSNHHSLESSLKYKMTGISLRELVLKN